VNDLDSLVDQWLTVPDVADVLAEDIGAVRRMLQDGRLLAIRRGPRNVLSIPAGLLGPEGLLPELPGTLTVLDDSGLDVLQSLRWLFTADESIQGGSPIAALRAGHKTEVRRRAQALAV
jgi:Rv2175c C-terminal domain of unknown function